MKCTSDAECEIVEWGKHAKKLSKAGGNKEGEQGVPNKEATNGSLGDAAFFPGNIGMCNIRKYCGNCCSDKIGEPEEIIVFNKKVGDNCEENVIKKRNSNSDKEIPSGMFGSLNVFS